MKKFLGVMFVAFLVLAFSGNVFAGDNYGTYYIDSVEDDDDGTWGTPNFVAGQLKEGDINVSYSTDPEDTEYNKDIGVAFYIDWDHVFTTEGAIKTSSLLPVFYGIFSADEETGDDPDDPDTASWDIPWDITPLDGPEGTVKGIWVVEGLGVEGDEDWDETRLVASDYFGEDDVEAIAVFDIYQQPAGEPDPNPDPTIPEPTTVLLFGSGLFGLVRMRFGKKKS